MRQNNTLAIKKPEFAAVGARDSNGTLSDAGTRGNYWASVASSSNYAYGLYFLSSDLGVYSAHHKRNGFSVRCVRQ